MSCPGSIVVLHGGGFTGGGPHYCSAFARRARAWGYHVVVPDSINVSHAKTEIILQALAEQASTLPQPVHLLGISSGGFLAVQLFVMKPLAFDRVVLIAPVLDPVKRASEVRKTNRLKAAELAERHRQYFGGDIAADAACAAVAGKMAASGRKALVLISTADSQSPCSARLLIESSLLKARYEDDDASHSTLCKSGPAFILDSNWFGVVNNGPD